MNEKIQESLCRDFRDLYYSFGRACSRSRMDNLTKAIRSMTITERAQAYKQLSTALASDRYGGEEAFNGITLGSAERIRAYRQCLGFFSRLHANVTKEQEQQQLAEACERLEATPPIHIAEDILHSARQFIRRVIGDAPPDLRKLRFRHGPGAVATHERGFEKLYFKETYLSVDEYLGYNSEVLLRLPNQPMRFLEYAIPETRVIAVPKDAQRIRIISCEPLTMQFLQQGLMDELYTRMSRYPSLFPLADQYRSRYLAKVGSLPDMRGQRTQPCTIDLSNASDDVRCEHVRLLFPAEWARVLLAFRSESARFESLGRVAILTTFAPMGAATCFPVETLVFAALAYATAKRHCRKGEPCLYAEVGDDCIIPAFAFQPVIETYREAGFSPNVSKCCGPAVRFRESCGGDYYDGIEVTIERPRTLPIFGRRQASVPTVRLATALAARGFRTTAQLLANTVHTPVAIGDGPAYGHYGLKWPNPGQVRWNRYLQRWEQQTMVEKPCTATPLGAVDGWEPLYNWFTSGWTTETSFPRRTYSSLAWLEIAEPKMG